MGTRQTWVGGCGAVLFWTLIGGSSLLAQDAPADTAARNPEQEGLPLAPERRVQVSTREASWMSVDVSPDGQTLVFDLLGDLYTLPFSGGRATPLTHGMAFDAQPRFSPDGARVVFTSDRSGGDNVWIIALDQSDTVQVTKGNDNSYLSPEWTPDGHYIVASKSPGPGVDKLWMYHVDGGSGVGLVKEPNNLRMMGAAFGNDDRYVWFARRNGSWQYNSGLGEFDLAVYDRETGEMATRSSRYGGAFRPTLSPDGRWLVYGTRQVAETGLRIRDLQSGGERWLAYPVQRDEMESRGSRDVLPGMSFTPDSRELVVSYGGGLWRVPIDGSAPIEIPFQVDVDLPIGPAVDFDYPIEDTPTFVAKQIRDAVPSPDGSKLAFAVLGDLYVMDFPDGTPRRLTTLALQEAHPVWSPDGRWIAFSTWSTEEGGHLYRVRTDGRGQPERVTSESAYYTDPVFSPDGTRIVALRSQGRVYDEALARGLSGGLQDLVWVPVSGGSASLIAPVENFGAPHFTRTSERIYVSGFQGLMSMRWDGTDRKTHVQVRGRSQGQGPGQPASAIWMAPQGDQALALVVNDLYLVTVPRVGGDVPTISVANPDNAAFPAKRLTDIGAQFPAWSADGARVHWSVGNAHFVYDLGAARAFADSVESARAAAGDSATAADSAQDRRGRGRDTLRYRPLERRVRIEVERDLPQGVVVLRGARIVTMRGDEIIERGDLVVRNNRIEAVGAQGSVAVPQGAQVIDVAGKTILPGFVDTHAHLRAQVDLLRDQPWSYAANLAYGVTTTRDPQTGTTDILSYEDFWRAGHMLAPRLYSTGPGVFSSEGISSLDQARDVLKRYSEYYDTKTIKMYGAGNRQVRQWIIQAAREQRLMPTTEGSLDLALNMTMGQDGYSGMEHNMPGFPLYDDVVQLVAQSQMAYTPTIIVTYGGPWGENYFYTTEDVFGNEKLRRFTPFEEVQQKALRRPGPTSPGGSNGWFHPLVHTFDRVARFARDVLRAGGRVGIGSHGQLQGLGYHWELWMMQSGGMTQHEALRVATLVGAQAIGLDNDLGSLEAGKLADLVVLDRNPLEDIRNSDSIRMVMINGRLHDGATLDEVWPRQRAAGPFYWQEDAMPSVPAGIR
ncbi:MAG: amidohydrolase family protein [Gemmatimonadota bacterium]